MRARVVCVKRAQDRAHCRPAEPVSLRGPEPELPRLSTNSNLAKIGEAAGGEEANQADVVAPGVDHSEQILPLEARSGGFFPDKSLYIIGTHSPLV
jgi:hypothetical protein